MSSSNVNEQTQFKVLGVCGGIGSGKSSACKLLVSELGCLAHLGMKEFIGNGLIHTNVRWILFLLDSNGSLTGTLLLM